MGTNFNMTLRSKDSQLHKHHEKLYPDIREDPNADEPQISSDEDVDVETVDVKVVLQLAVDIKHQDLRSRPVTHSIQSPKHILKPKSAQGSNGGKNKDENTMFRNIALFVVGTLISCAAIYFGYMWYSRIETLEKQNFQEVAVKFQEKLKVGEKKFPSQKGDAWRKIRAVVKATTKLLEPKYPGVIALMASTSDEAVANCMGWWLANNLKEAYNDSTIVNLNGKSFRGKLPGDVIWEIQTAVESGLQQDLHVILLEGLQHFPAESSRALHGLCDNSNAPYKQVVYILTSVTDKFLKDEVDEEITSIWKTDLDESTRHSLETRIGNNIVKVNPEKNALDCK